jgi:two-component system NarL family sensor kinase
LLPSSKFSRLALVVACLLAASLLIVVRGMSSSATIPLVLNLLQCAVALCAAFCCFYVARLSSGYLRQLWMFLAVALSIAAGAQGLETYYQNVAHLSPLTPWPSDILFIFWVMPAVAMLLQRPAEGSEEIDWQRILDFAQLGVVGLTAYLYFFYTPSQWQVQGPEMVFKVMRLQLFRDAALATLFLIRAAALPVRPIRKFFGGMSCLFLLASAADVVYLVFAHPSASQAGWSDVAWCAPYLFATVFAATWEINEEHILLEATSASRRALVTQILPVCLPLLVLFMARRIAVERTAIAWAAVTGSFVLSIARLILTNERQRRIANELQKTEQSLARSEHMFSTAFRLSPDPVGISLVPEGRFVEVNDSFTRFTGYAREETLGRTPEEMNLWVDISHRARVMAKLREQGEVRDEEFRCRMKSGEIQIGQFSGALIEIDGRLYALVVVRDVTARKQMEEALRASEKRFRTLVESLSVGIVLLGPQAEILFANQAAQQMFNMPIEAVLGKNTSEVGLVAVYEDGTEMPFSMRPGPRAIATEKAVRNEVMGWRRRDSHEVLWILGDVVPLLGENGQLDKLVVSFSDITKRKQAEEALHQLSTRLLQLQDEERRRLGRELHDSLAQSVLAVNLNLAQIAGASAPLDQGSQRAVSEARRLLQEMSQEIRTISYLLHPPVLDELGLTSAIKEYAMGFSERSGIKLEVDFQAGFRRLSQEAETALFRIVQESLSNIQRHSGSEAARIRLREEWGCVELEVSDRGHGMGQMRAESGNTRGTRLGVGILGMRERMVQLGGKLDVESSSSGTKVRATIPVKVEVSHAPSHPSGG